MSIAPSGRQVSRKVVRANLENIRQTAAQIGCHAQDPFRGFLICEQQKLVPILDQEVGMARFRLTAQRCTEEMCQSLAIHFVIGHFDETVEGRYLR